MTPEQVANLLSQPVKVNKLTLKNRLVMGPMAAASRTRDGRPSEGADNRRRYARPYPDYARKAMEGRLDKIVRCDRNGSCMKRLALSMPTRYTQNPRMGHESRRPGVLPPLNRLPKAPLEPVMVGLAGSQHFMNLVGLFMKKNRPKACKSSA